MSSTGEHIKEGVTWTWAQVRRALIAHTLVGLLVALVAAFGTYWYASYKDIAVRMEKNLPPFESSLTNWLQVTSETLSEANSNISDTPHLPSKEDARNIQKSVTRLIASLNSVPTPTSGIESSSSNLRHELTEVVRAIGSYDGSPETATMIVVASNNAAMAGSIHKKAIEDYLGSALNRLTGSF